jgi:lipopolysaccharide/colanic/teichoic acid biosynthesis glycosyltransferase
MQMNDLAEDIGRACVPVGLVQVTPKRGLYRNVLKRLFDITFVLVVGIVVAPFVLGLAFVIALDGQAPFYRSERVGRFGRTFSMLKLRTMVKDADKQLDDYLQQDAQARSEWDEMQKLKLDPRITRIGRLLRKFSLDELPQLWNVLVGDMSLVGPRPMMPSQRSLYTGLAYYGLRPGLTGIWQISDRNASGFSKRVKFDSEYDEMLSFGTDLRLIMRTFSAVARGTGY